MFEPGALLIAPDTGNIYMTVSEKYDRCYCVYDAMFVCEGPTWHGELSCYIGMVWQLDTTGMERVA